MRLINVESARSPTEHEAARAVSKAATTAWPPGAEDQWTSATAETAFPLHAIAEFLNSILKLIRIHAEILRLSHSARDRDGFGRRIAARSIRGQATGDRIVIRCSRSGNSPGVRFSDGQTLHASVR